MIPTKRAQRPNSELMTNSDNEAEGAVKDWRVEPSEEVALKIWYCGAIVRGAVTCRTGPSRGELRNFKSAV